MSKQKLFLSGDHTYPLFHPLKAVDGELIPLIEQDFEIALNTEHFETLESWDYESFACVVLYNDHWIDKSPTAHQQVQALLHYVSQGGGLVVVHNLDPGVDVEMAQMLGARLKKTLSPQNHAHVSYVPYASDHPILEGVGPFELEDDLFDMEFSALTERQDLLGARLPNGLTVPMAWAIEFGLGRVVYTAPGHDISAFQNEQYRKFLRGCMRWTARQI